MQNVVSSEAPGIAQKTTGNRSLRGKMKGRNILSVTEERA